MKKWNIKSIVKEIIIAALILFVVTNVLSYIRKPTLESSALPDIKAVLLDGRKYEVKKGKPLVVHFWATWCPTCKLEAPNIESISKEYEVLTIAVGSGKDIKVSTYMKERGLSFQVINDKEGEWAKQFKVEAYPTTFIYDSKGELRFTEVGYTTTAGLFARLKMSEK